MNTIDEARLDRLMKAAAHAAIGSYPRYSGFSVLAAVERTDGEVFGGANVEIANYSLTKHAEEAAALAAIAQGALELGDRWLTAVYTAGVPPCGSCRQFLWEWATPGAVCVVDLGDRCDVRLLSELYPVPFDPSTLPDRREGPTPP